MGNDMFVSISNAFTNVERAQDGSISRKNGIRMLQEIFKNNSGVIAMEKSDRASYSNTEGGLGKHPTGFGHGYGFGYGYGFGGMLSQTKDLFDLYMDKDSAGGENITPEEQQEIMETVNNWAKPMKNIDIRQTKPTKKANR